MGIYPQPNAWQCGPFALKHALMVYGQFEREDDIARIAGTDTNGTDESELARAAARYHCRLEMARHDTPRAARGELVTRVRDGVPVLACIYEWGHWVTVVAEEDDRFVVFDSRDEAVLRIIEWRRFQDMLAYRGRNQASAPIYDLHPLVAERPPRCHARFTVTRARYLRLPEHRGFATSWTENVRALLVTCPSPTTQRELTMRLADLLGDRQAVLLRPFARQGPVVSRTAARLLDNLRFAADLYGLEVRPDDELRALGGVRTLLDRWVRRELETIVTDASRPSASP